MSILSRIFGWFHGLSPAQTRAVKVERDLRIRMPDGVVLLANRYAPRDGDGLPTILVRSPYGRDGLWGLIYGVPFAERGFQVLIQSCRGTFGSEGDFDPFRKDRDDGLATVRWIREQPWFSGKLAMMGASYMGYVQWAIGAEAGPDLRALSIDVSFSDVRASMFAGGSFWLDTALTWVFLVANQERSLARVLLTQARGASLLAPAMAHLPLRTADEVAIGREALYLRDWVDHAEPGDPWWEPIGFAGKVGDVDAPVRMLGGFFDVFLPQTLADYRRLRDAGKTPYLTLGPWAHGDTAWATVSLNETLAWFRAHLLDDTSALQDEPVRVFVMGGKERLFHDWPPPGTRAVRHHLQSGGGLSAKAPAPSEPDRFRYDPADPTPAVGGSSLSKNAGSKDNRKLEKRADVLLYTSEPLTEDVEVIGPVTAEVFVLSTLENADFFVRLCDVHPSGKSMNVSDGITRLRPGVAEAGEDGIRKVTVEMWATACLFKKGHRIRLQVSSGAHPRHARNTGSGEPLGAATTLVAADQTVFHDPAHPSAIVLPVLARAPQISGSAAAGLLAR